MPSNDGQGYLLSERLGRLGGAGSLPEFGNLELGPMEMESTWGDPLVPGEDEVSMQMLPSKAMQKYRDVGSGRDSAVSVGA